ncbi:unnamed protein product [Knipowitschia caucasica]
MNVQRRKALKTTIHITSQILWLVGVTVGLVGLYLLLKFRQSSIFFATSSFMMLPILVTFATAASLLVTGFLGTWVSTRDSKELQGLFVYLLFVVFCLGTTAAALAFHHFHELDSEILPLRDVFKNYTGSSQDQNSRAVDILQESMECCGVRDYSDWTQTSWFHQNGGIVLPRSCCNPLFVDCDGDVLQPFCLNQMGCEIVFKNMSRFLLRTLMWLYGALVQVLIVSLVPVVMLMKEPLQPYQSLSKR